MRVTIIKGQESGDQSVGVDGATVHGVDFTGVTEDIWAVNWDSGTNKGEIEYNSNTKPNLEVTTEAEIDAELGVTLQTMLDRRQAILDQAQQDAEDLAEAEAAANPTPPEWEMNRLSEYPSISEMVVALYDTDDKAAIDTKRAAVKAKWPKDNSGPIE